MKPAPHSSRPLFLLILPSTRVLCPAQCHCSMCENESWSKRLTPHILMNKLSEPRAACLHSGASSNIQTAVGLAPPHQKNLQIVQCTLLSQASLLSNPGPPPPKRKSLSQTGQTNKTPHSAATPNASGKCQHPLLSSLHLHAVQRLCPSVCPHISCPNLPNFFHLHFIPEGPYWILARSCHQQPRQRSSQCLPEGAGPTAPIFSSSKRSEWLWDLPSTAEGSRHYATGTGMQLKVHNGTGCKVYSRVTTSAPQPSTLIMTPKGCN